VTLDQTRRSRRFILLDRDGTLNVERHYLSAPEQLELYPGVGTALRRLRTLDFGLAVVTNQSGVARGYFDMATLARIHDRLRAILAAEGVELDGIFLCPHSPDGPCDCRKPLPGLVRQAAAALDFDPAQAFLIGDKAIDIALAHAVGARGILVRTGWGRKAEAEDAGDPAVIVDDLPAAVDWIETVLAAERR
jgi:D-glycero-D-manno-heptose 1,7-bisphosphate phosphatase